MTIPNKFRRLGHAAIILAYFAALVLFFAGCAHGAFAAAPAAATLKPWYGEPATVWDFLKWLIAGGAMIVGWAIRVEMRLANHGGTLESQAKTITKHDEILASNAKLLEKHESLLENHIKSLNHIEKTLDEWTVVKEDRAARLMKIETRMERLDKIEGKLDAVLAMRQEQRYARQENP